jgi:hypothetical protein
MHRKWDPTIFVSTSSPIFAASLISTIRRYAKEDGQRGSDKEIETPPIEKVAQCFVHHTNNQHVL